MSCRIINAGGRFVILVPNLPEIENRLSEFKKEIDEWFYRTFLGKLSLNLAWDVNLSREGFSSHMFSKKLKEMSNRLELSKKRRFEDMVKGGHELLDGAMREAFDVFQKDGNNCEFCKVYPIFQDKRCVICLDSEKTGQALVSNPLLYFYENKRENGIDVLGYTITFQEAGDDWVLLEKIGDAEVNENPGYVKRHISNYIPEKQKGDIDLDNEKPDSGATLCRFCGSRCKLEGDISMDVSTRKELVSKHLTFQCISASTKRNNAGKGVDHLAVVKADVDDLGLVFSQGLGDTLSISRYASLSRMLDYFFTGWLTHEISSNHRMTYTVYAGGDDLLLIAPWEDALELGSKIGKTFKTYVGENPNITISMGINLMRPNSPVGLATDGAEEYLEKSKGVSGKNSITIFDTTIKWDNFDPLNNFMKILNVAFNEEDAKVNASFLYRLLKYHEMYKGFMDKDQIEGLRFHSLMSRDVRRNILKKDKAGNILNEGLIHTLQPLYEVGEGFNAELMKSLKIPVFWTLYKNRGGV